MRDLGKGVAETLFYSMLNCLSKMRTKQYILRIPCFNDVFSTQVVHTKKDHYMHTILFSFAKAQSVRWFQTYFVSNKLLVCMYNLIFTITVISAGIKLLEYFLLR